MKPAAAEIDLHDIVRSADPARYFANQFVPATHRNDVFLLHGFDLEIRKIARTIREPMAGEIRLQWWREVFGGSRTTEAAASPLAQMMLDFSQRHSVGSQIWDNYLDGRIFDLYDDAVEDRAAFEAYAGQTDGTVLQLACLVLDRGQSSSASQVSGYLACVLCLWNRVLQPILYADQPPAPELVTRISRYLPPELRQAAGFVANPYLESKAVDTAQAVSEICAVAETYLEKARAAADAVPATLRPAFLSVAPIASQLSKIQQDSGPPLPMTEISKSGLIWRLWRSSKRWPYF
ncbi:MAG: squalene/phytoene synthase family protein [Hyphomicrobiales bacterium]